MLVIDQGGQSGAAIVEFIGVTILLLTLLLAILQVAAYIYVRNIVVASAAEGARYSAAAGASPAKGAEKTSDMIAKSVGKAVAAGLQCQGSQSIAEHGLQIVQVRCSGTLGVFFLPVAKDVLPLDVSGRAVKENQ